MKMHRNLIMLRHLEDIQDYSIPFRDVGLIDNNDKKAKILADNILHYLEQDKFQKIIFISSDKRRTIDTTKLIISNFDKTTRGVIQDTLIDKRINDLYHGEYNLPKSYKPGDTPKARKIADIAFRTETFEKENLLYKNGDYTSLHPQLHEMFLSPGEHQCDFSLRFYEFVSEIVRTCDKNTDVLYILVTHTAIIFRMFELMYMFDKEKKKVQTGKITFLEWECTKYLDHSKEKMFVSTGEIKDLDYSPILDNISLLDAERKYLKDCKE